MFKMIFVYPYKRKTNDFCISQSIRLVKKYFPESTIYTVGDKVEGINNIPFVESSIIKGSNVTAKMLHCATLFDKFVYMNDDFFINKRLDFNQTLKGSENLERKEGKASIAWNQASDNTKHFLEFNNYSITTYECHQPVLFDSKKLINTFKNIDWKSNDHFLKSLYFNINTPKKSLEIDNVKLKEPNISKANFYLTLYGCLSIGQGFLNKKGVEFIKSL